MDPLTLPELDPLDALLLARLDDDGGRHPPDEERAARSDNPHTAVRPVPKIGSGPTPAIAHDHQPADKKQERSTLKLTPASTERRAYEVFARRYSATEFREWFASLYPLWRTYNATYFEGRLEVPHIGIGLTTPRRFSECRQLTDHGGQINIVLAERIVFLNDRRVVRTDNPNAMGLQRFVADLLLGETVKQSVLELRGDDECGWGGRGPLFCREANQIGESLGLPQVEPRRRGYRGLGQPVAALWPYAFRPDGYYLGHVQWDSRRVPTDHTLGQANRYAVPGIYEYFLYLLGTGRTARLTDILGRVVDAEKEVRLPALAAAERGPQDASGMPLPMPLIDPDWLTWNGGCVRAIAEGILRRRAFDGMPILADALQDAGCENDLILNHCRAFSDHTAKCWVLRLLTEPAQT
jgi:hypothetical protein